MIFFLIRLRARNKLGVLILLLALAPLPAVPRHMDAWKNHTLLGVKCEDGDWARQLAMTVLLLNPFYLMHIVFLFAMGVAIFLLLLDAVVKGVFLICTISVHFATAPCRLNHKPVPR